MDLGSFISGLLTGLREGVEAALIVSIVITYLVKTGNGAHASKIWIGTGLAVVVSVAGSGSPSERIFTAATAARLVAPAIAEPISATATRPVAMIVLTWPLAPRRGGRNDRSRAAARKRRR